MADCILPLAGDLPVSRSPLSVRVRFEVFKRDEFTCRYCGRRSPDAVLEVDHIVAVSNGGSDDPMNLITSCWDCNRGKSNVPLERIITGDDPHAKAIEILERERQLEEYNAVLARDIERRSSDAWDLAFHWLDEQGKLSPAQQSGDEAFMFDKSELSWLKQAMAWCPREKVREFMDIAISKRMTRNMAYVCACARNWRYEHAANQDTRKGGN